MKETIVRFNRRSIGPVCGLLLVNVVALGSASRANAAQNPKMPSSVAQEQAQPQPAVQRELPPSEWKEKLAAPDETKSAGQYYKNLKIMGDMPAPKLAFVMKNFAISLGVRCTHCHILGEFSRDDVPEKETARQMIRMVRATDKEYFPGKTGPTCWTCHRGNAKPEYDPPASATVPPPPK